MADNEHTVQDLENNLDYIKETKDLMRIAINNKGQNISESDTFRSYATAISNIPIGVDISDATVNASEVLVGKTIYNSTGKITGSMPNIGNLNLIPNLSNQNIPFGYTSGGTISAVTSNIDSNIQPGNIREGVEILGITGTYEGDQTPYIEKIEQLEQDIEDYRDNLANDTIIDNPITIADGAELPLKDFAIEGKTEQFTTTGKNKLRMILSNIKSRNTNGTWNGDTYTLNGVTFTVNEDLSITVGGTYISGDTVFYLTPRIL